MKRYPTRIIILLLLFVALAGHCQAASNSITVSAVILSKSNCKFNTAAATIDFGDLNPIAAPNVTREATLYFVCHGADKDATYLVTDDDGLYGNRMRHSTDDTAFLPYSLALSPASATIGKGEEKPLTVTGTVLGNDYRTAIAGAYSDTVTLTINP